MISDPRPNRGLADSPTEAFPHRRSTYETSFGLSKGATARVAEIASQAQATLLKTYQANTALVQNLIADASASK